MDKAALTHRRKRMILTGLSFLGLLALIWFLLVSPSQVSLQETRVAIGLAKTEMANAQRAVNNKERVKIDLAAAVAKLKAVETGIAQGDVLRWVINTLLSFQEDYNIKFDLFEPAAGGAPKPLPGLPYEVSIFTVGGVAQFHDFGNFLANFENLFPHIGIQYIGLEPATELRSDPQARGKLNFRMELAIMIKPSVDAAKPAAPNK